MKRRGFLRAMGLSAGAPLLMPFFHDMLRAQEMGTKPRRFVIFVEGNGIESRAIMPQAVKDAIEAAGGNLQRYAYRGYKHDKPLIKKDISIGDAISTGALKGGNGEVSLEDKSALILGLSSKVVGGGHATQTGALSASKHRKVGPAGPTIDAAIARSAQIKGHAPFDAVRLGVQGRGASVVYDICAFDKNKPAPLIIDPRSAFNVLFGSVSTGMGRKVFVEKNELLDFTRQDVKRALEAMPGNSPERAKLESYIESVEALAQRQHTIEAMSDALHAVKPSEPEETSIYDSSDPFDILRAQTDLATAALKGGLTNVVVIAMGASGAHGFMDYPGLNTQYLGRQMASHDVRHGAEHGNEGCIDVLHGITREYLTHVARMARSLEATTEVGADGTMLDHTAILYMSNNGEKHHSNADEWPMIMIGGQGMGFQTDGRAVIYPGVGQDDNRRVSNLFHTFGHCVGLDLDAFGEESVDKRPLGPLSDELWRA